MKRAHILLAGLTGIIIILAIVQISVSNMLSTGGLELAQVQNQIDTYQRENAILKEQIYSAASLTAIAAKAEKLGYTSVTTGKAILVVANPEPLALKQ